MTTLQNRSLVAILLEVSSSFFSSVYVATEEKTSIYKIRSAREYYNLDSTRVGALCKA